MVHTDVTLLYVTSKSQSWFGCFKWPNQKLSGWIRGHCGFLVHSTHSIHSNWKNAKFLFLFQSPIVHPFKLEKADVPFFRHPDHTPIPVMWAHHEKLVIIDQVQSIMG